MPQASREEIGAKFMALFLGSKVQSDQQVPGTDEWWKNATPWQRNQLSRYSYWTWVKVINGRDQDEAISAAVAAFREQLRNPPFQDKPSSPEYAAFRFGIINEILSMNLTPIEVARKLEAEADNFPEISYEECRRYREMGEVWQPWSGEPLPPERIAQIKAQRAFYDPPGRSNLPQEGPKDARVATERALDVSWQSPEEIEAPDPFMEAE